MDLKNSPLFNPAIEPASSVVHVDAAQFAALQTLVTALIAMTASGFEKTQAGRGQVWINQISAVCQDAILAAGIDGLESHDVDDFRKQVIEQINIVLKGVALPYAANRAD